MKKIIAIFMLGSAVLLNGSDMPPSSSQGTSPEERGIGYAYVLQFSDGLLPITKDEWNMLTTESQLFKDLASELITVTMDKRIFVPSAISKEIFEKLLLVLKAKSDISTLSFEDQLHMLGCVNYLGILSLKNLLDQLVAKGLRVDTEGWLKKFKNDPQNTIALFTGFGIDMADLELGHALILPFINSLLTMDDQRNLARQTVNTLRGHIGAVMSVAWSPDGKYLASGSWDNTIRIWDTGTWQTVNIVRHADPILSVAWSPDGKYLASGSWDATIRIWDTGTWQTVNTLRGHIGDVMSVAWSPDGRYLASGAWDRDRTIRIWDTGTWQTVNILQGHTAGILSVAWSHDGKYLASGSWDRDRTIRIWETGTWQTVNILQGHTAAIFSVAWSLDGKYLASGSLDSAIRIWDTGAGQTVNTLWGHTAAIISVAWSHDGKYLASGSWDRTIRIWNVAKLRYLDRISFLDALIVTSLVGDLVGDPDWIKTQQAQALIQQRPWKLPAGTFSTWRVGPASDIFETFSALKRWRFGPASDIFNAIIDYESAQDQVAPMPEASSKLRRKKERAFFEIE